MTTTPTKKFWRINGKRRVDEAEVMKLAVERGYNATGRTAVEAACWLGRFAKAKGHKVEFDGFGEK